LEAQRYRDELIRRIDECQTVVKELENSTAWKIIIKDLEMQRKLIDDNWHLVTDEKKLQEFRITKFAIMQLLNTKYKYEEDLKATQEELEKFDNPNKEISKDYDNETILEGV